MGELNTESFSDWETKDFITEIKKLRKENASRRTKGKELEEKCVSLNESIESKNEEIESNSEKFGKLQAALDSLNRDHEIAKKKLGSTSFVSLESVNLLKKEYEDNAVSLSNENSNLKIELSKQEILRNAYNTLNEKEYKFRNTQERIGFESFILSTKENGENKSQEEVMNEVHSFLDSNFQVPKTPPVGPIPNRNRINPAVELAKIMRQDQHSKADLDRMMILEKEIEAMN